MNPCLEQRDLWRVLHGSYLGRLRAVLNPLVLPRFAVTFEESLSIDPTDDDPELFDVADTALRRVGRPRGPVRQDKEYCESRKAVKK